MTVKELIAKLQKVDPNRLVVMSKDGEGNGFSPLCNLVESKYRSDSTWSGEIGLEKLTPSLKKQGYSEEDVMEDGIKALVLWPTN